MTGWAGVPRGSLVRGGLPDETARGDLPAGSQSSWDFSCRAELFHQLGGDNSIGGTRSYRISPRWAGTGPETCGRARRDPASQTRPTDFSQSAATLSGSSLSVETLRMSSTRVAVSSFADTAFNTSRAAPLTAALFTSGVTFCALNRFFGSSSDTKPLMA